MALSALATNPARWQRVPFHPAGWVGCPARPFHVTHRVPVPRTVREDRVTAPAATLPALQPLPPMPIPQYYRLSQVAARLSVSEKTIARLVEGDPDLLVISEKRRGIRSYRTVLIPDSSLRKLVDGLKQ